MAFLILTILLLGFYCLLLVFYRNSWVAIKDFVPKKTTAAHELPFVSIIIAARNEEAKIGACIKSVIRQTYPLHLFELLIVNDHSTDDTVAVIQSFGKNNIRVIHLADHVDNEVVNSYKKKSIETALGYARGELIITTDADCIVPEKWLETMVAFYKEKDPVFIAAPVLFNGPSAQDSFIKKCLKVFQSLDFMTLQGITGASVSRKFHGMCNGANLAYEKKVFYAVNGFEGIDAIASGDDMLLMHKIQSRYPERIRFIKSPDVIVKTRPAETLNAFMNQRIRWASKADKYSDKKITAVLLLVYLLNAWMLILGIASFFSLSVFYIFLISFFIKVFAELFFLFPVADFFGKKKLLRWFVLAQPFHILYTLVAGWLGQFGSFRWKGRKVK